MRPMASTYKKPLPRVDEESKGFWEACRRHELRVQKCTACGTYRFYPRGVCPQCMSSDVEWVRSSGHGTVYTFTVTYQNQMPGFREELPYVLAYVKLEEGPLMLSNIVDCDLDQATIGRRVQVCFKSAEDGHRIPMFRPAD